MKMEATDSEAICRLFHSYDFDGDVDFQSGCKTILQHSEQGSTDDILQAKVFYFSRKFGKLTLSEYRRWLKNTDQRTVDCEQRNMNRKSTEKSIDESVFSDDETKMAKLCNTDEGTDLTQDGISSEELCGQFNSQADINKESEKEHEKVYDFGQVVEMISKGLSLPGITELGIRPLEVEPTTARLERKTKPWEQG